MKSKADNPGIYVPPPLLYVAVFLVAIFLQSLMPVNHAVFQNSWIKILGAVLIAIAVFYFAFRSLRQFFLTKNTVITHRAANSLQTTGIYAITRNPMYTGLAITYLGVTCYFGNWWNVILFPVLILLVQELIIKREEKYLERRFGDIYLEYKKRVRRWL